MQGGSGGIWGKDECKSEETRKAGYGRKRDFKKGELPGKFYGKDVVWIGWWKIWGGVLKEAGEELVKMEVSFSRGETLKRSNIKIVKSGLSFLLFSFLIFILFLI